MTPSVTAVIPTVGRASVSHAVQSVLDQTRPVTEIIVVADTDAVPVLPDDDRIVILHTPFRSGASRSRQIGIDAARGDVVALLDDDDGWHATKLERQLGAIDSTVGRNWVASSRFEVIGPGDRRRVWPRRLIGCHESVPHYLFRFTDLRVGGADLQSSTLCFPTELARKVRWDADAEPVHDEATWLILVQRSVPSLQVIQLPDVLSTYNVSSPSLSRSASDRTSSYIDWGLQYLDTASPRVRGDYLCTYPVSAAVSARSLQGVRAAMRSAFSHGRPGPFAIGYAVLNAARIGLHSARSVGHR